jgi:hypothetical protein
MFFCYFLPCKKCPTILSINCLKEVNRFHVHHRYVHISYYLPTIRAVLRCLGKGNVGVYLHTYVPTYMHHSDRVFRKETNNCFFFFFMLW